MMGQPAGWNSVTVADIATGLKSGLSRRLSSKDIGLPVLRSNNLIHGSGVDYSDIKYWHKDDPQGANTENYVLKDGDLLINFINSVSAIGKCSIFTDVLQREVIYTTNIMCLRVSEELILPRYFLYLTETQSYKSYIQAITKPAVNQASFTTVDFKNWAFILPPLAEQGKIAEILGTWDAAIATVEQLIAALQRRKQGLMQRLLTGEVRFPEFEGVAWDEVELKQIVTMVGGGTPSTKIDGYWNGTLPWITGADLDENVLRLNRVRRHITPEAVRNSATSVVPKGDILFVSRTGVGKIAIAPFDVAISQDLTGLSIKANNVDNRYLLYSLYWSLPKLSRLNQGTSINGITRDALGHHTLELPSLTEQKQIATILDASSEQIEKLERYKERLNFQKKGLMQRLLTGQVRVQVGEGEVSASNLPGSFELPGR